MTTIHKAQSIGGHTVPDLLLVATTTFAHVTDHATIAEARTTFQEEARFIATRLRESLPGGTIDALLVELLDMKRSSLVVPL